MKSYKIGISVFVPTYNEENRISYTLQSLSWCNEVILLDKHSSDCTVEIAKKYSNVKVLYMENYEAYSTSEFDIFYKACQYKYHMVTTASDIIHPALAKAISVLISDKSFDYDAIEIPYKGYFLGIYDKYSPWYATYSKKIIKTSSVSMSPGSVHNPRKFFIETVYTVKMPKPDESYYHLTHESANGIIDRHARYWKGEAASPEPLSSPLKIVIRETIKFIFIKRTFFKGKAAIALAFSFLSYYMMTYVCKWDYLYGNANDVYSNIRKSISEKWNAQNQEVD